LAACQIALGTSKKKVTFGCFSRSHPNSDFKVTFLLVTFGFAVSETTIFFTDPLEKETAVLVQ